MAKLNIQVMERDYERLDHVAKQMGRTIQGLVHEWIKSLPEQNAKKVIDITRDPIYQMEGYESSATKDLSKNVDRYLYCDRCSR